MRGIDTLSSVSTRWARPPQPSIVVPLRTEPRAWMANERTFLSWAHISCTLASMAAALAAFNASPLQTAFAGLIAAQAMLFMFSATWTFLARQTSLDRKSGRGYQSRLAPFLLLVGVTLTVVASVGHAFSDGDGRARAPDDFPFEAPLPQPAAPADALPWGSLSVGGAMGLATALFTVCLALILRRLPCFRACELDETQEARLDHKTGFSAERTCVAWVAMGGELGGLGSVLLVVSDSPELAGAGLVLLAPACILTAFAGYTYYQRCRLYEPSPAGIGALRTRLGPALAVTVVTVAAGFHMADALMLRFGDAGEEE